MNKFKAYIDRMKIHPSTVSHALGINLHVVMRAYRGEIEFGNENFTLLEKIFGDSEDDELPSIEKAIKYYQAMYGGNKDSLIDIYEDDESEGITGRIIEECSSITGIDSETISSEWGDLIEDDKLLIQIMSNPAFLVGKQEFFNSLSEEADISVINYDGAKYLLSKISLIAALSNYELDNGAPHNMTPDANADRDIPLEPLSVKKYNPLEDIKARKAMGLTPKISPSEVRIVEEKLSSLGWCLTNEDRRAISEGNFLTARSHTNYGARTLEPATAEAFSDNVDEYNLFCVPSEYGSFLIVDLCNDSLDLSIVCGQLKAIIDICAIENDSQPTEVGDTAQKLYYRGWEDSRTMILADGKGGIYTHELGSKSITNQVSIVPVTTTYDSVQYHDDHICLK